MTTTARPPLVLSAEAYCTAHAEHTHRLIFDGATAYAYSVDRHARDAEEVLLDGDTLTVECLENDRGDDPCPGRVTWDADTAWTSDADAITLLTAYGKPVTR